MNISAISHEITFTVPSLPVAQPRQRHRVAQINGRAMAVNYTPAKSPINDFKATVRMAAKAAYNGAPLTGPVRCDITFVFPRPQAKVWKTRPMPRYWHTKKPDRDNLDKAVLDTLSGLLWRDDCQVCYGTIQKVHAAGDEQPRVEVRVCELLET